MNIEPVYKINYKATYAKYKDIAKVSYRVFLNRIAKGFTIEDALTHEHKQNTFYRPYIEIANKNGIHTATFYNRLTRGWSIEEAMTVKTIKPYKPSTREKPKNNIKDTKLIANIILEFGYPALSKKQKQFVNENMELFKEVLR